MLWVLGVSIGLLALVGGIVAGRSASSSARAQDGVIPGQVRFVKHLDSGTDHFTARASVATKAWMNRNLWRAVVFTPYFDDKTSWYHRGWVYQDLYAIYRGSSLARTHADWVLRSRSGGPMYIPFDCHGGTCPQYAADIGNPGFRSYWIERTRKALAKGYAGVFIDDVNLAFRVGDGAGRERAPIDPRTRQPMTAEAWRGYVATFTEQIRRALPGVEIVHNAVWFAGSPADDRYVARETKAADWVNVERGLNDPGLTGGAGPFSLTRLLDHIDQAHALETGVILDGTDGSARGREYNLAGYFLISTGHDAVGLGSASPTNFWRGYQFNLGAATGDRTNDHGVWRRSFERGEVLLNGPGGARRTIALGRAMVDSAGRTVRSVTLGARQGAVLRTPAS